MSYRSDVPIITGHAMSGADGLVDVILFALLTIQQPLSGVKETFADVQTHGSASVYLFGFKKAGWVYAINHRDVLWGALKAAKRVYDTEGFIDVLLNVPGLGLVKAGFVAQMCGFIDAGCLDSHNLGLHGLDYNEVRFDKKSTKKPTLRSKKIRHYLAKCRTLGGAEGLWDAWCKHYAGLYGGSADEVSFMHVEAMGLMRPAEPEEFDDSIPF